MTSLYFPIRGLKARGFVWNCRILIRIGRDLERVGHDADIAWTVRRVRLDGLNSLPGEQAEVLQLTFDDPSMATAYRVSSRLRIFTRYEDAEAWIHSQVGQPIN